MPLLPSFIRNMLPGRRKALQSVGTSTGGWYPIIHEPFAGAWQRNIEINRGLASAFYADFACRTLIARDIAKLRLKLIERDASGIWTEVRNNPAYSPLLRKPNHFQTRNQFVETWILSKLSRGNTYALKVRDARRVVASLYVLNPDRVTPLIADDGSIFYRLSTDLIGSIKADVTVPAGEIIHDRMNASIGDGQGLVGIPPIYASGLASTQGLNIQSQSVRLFANNSQPGGILTAPGRIADDTATRLKEHWEQNYSGHNVGRVAVLGDGLKYEKMSLTAEEAQLIEQLKMSAEIVCSTYHVPAFMVMAGAEPTTGSAQERTLRYYTQCLQSLIEDFEACLNEGIGLGEQFDLSVEFDIDKLLRMDSVSQADFVTKLTGGGVMAPNEARKTFNLPKLEGGDTVYMQQQDIPMSVAASVKEHPLNAKPAPAPQAEPEADDEDETDDTTREFEAWRLQKSIDAALEAVR